MKRELFLLRHTAVALDAGICYGRSDVPLQVPPHAHAKGIQPLLPSDAPLYSSPLSRCRLLAEQLGRPLIDARLQELDFGEWELQAFDALPRSAIDAWATAPWDFRPPAGETGAELQARVAAVLDEILASHARAIIVSHSGPLRVICGLLLGLPRADWLTQAMPLGQMVLLQETDGRWARR